MVIISKSRDEINCNKIVSKHELTSRPRCLMDRTCSLYNSHEGKSKLLSVLKIHAGMNSSISYLKLTVLQLAGSVCYIYYRRQQIKTGADLVNCLFMG